ncbi:MAG: cysteine desulfurase [Patescibacteria group bacterium]|nr:cysteine desulfurase [Patescibacteria group bacterium]
MSWLKGKDRKKDFPTFRSEWHTARPYHYLDSAASSLTPKQVLDAMCKYYRKYRANVHRGMYRASAIATQEMESAREKVADMIGASVEEIVFTRGATEALNLVAYSLSREFGEGDEVVISIMEHHANLVPWQQMAKQRGFRLKFIPLAADRASLDMEAARTLIGPQTKVISVVHVSNALGTVNPVAELRDLARQYGATFIIDAAQSVGHRPVSVKELDCDFLAFSGHKTYGPTGIGALYGKKERLEKLEPFLFGGDMIEEVTKEDSIWSELPWKFEAGTPNIAGAIGLGAAVEYMESIGIEEILKHEREMTSYAIRKLVAMPGVRVIGPGNIEDRGGAVSFEVEGVHPHDVAHILGQKGVSVRGGHHCAMPLMQELGVPGTARASFGIYTEKKDIDALIDGIEHIKETFKV